MVFERCFMFDPLSQNLYTEKNIELFVNNDEHHAVIAKVAYAFSSPERIKILKSFLWMPKTLSDVAKELSIPISSVSRHVDILADANLITSFNPPNIKGHKRYSVPSGLTFTFSLGSILFPDTEKTSYSVEMPLGLFTQCDIKPPCGLAGKKEKIGQFDSPESFFSPERISAELLWFSKGFISYNFPFEPLTHHTCTEISFSFEICSETTYYNNNWPSDITVFINDTEVTTFTSPGDFGGRRGKYTPQYWEIFSTQFGLLKNITINGQGVFVDNSIVSESVTFDALRLYETQEIKLTIGIKEDAVHCGGVNLFGKKFGDHPQSIVMTVR